MKPREARLEAEVEVEAWAAVVPRGGMEESDDDGDGVGDGDDEPVVMLALLSEVIMWKTRCVSIRFECLVTKKSPGCIGSLTVVSLISCI